MSPLEYDTSRVPRALAVLLVPLRLIPSRIWIATGDRVRDDPGTTLRAAL